MELNPHDLIRINNREDLSADLPFPDWAAASLQNAPYVVVRRATSPEGFIPIGIRGRKRGERFAAWLKPAAVLEVITPQMIASAGQKHLKRNEFNNSLRSLERITPFLEQEGLCWGPTGSTGFELATGVQTLSADSDLDLTLRFSEALPVNRATILLNRLTTEALTRLDIQIETPMGGVSLAEYVNCSTVLVKTIAGPLLIKRPNLWTTTEIALQSHFPNTSSQ